MISHFWRKLIPPKLPGKLHRHQLEGINWRLTVANPQQLGGLQIQQWIEQGLATVVKDGLQRTIYKITLGSEIYYLKRIRANTPRAWLREIFRPAKARLEFENAQLLNQLRIPCVEAVAYGVTSNLLPGESLILTRAVVDATPLDEFLETQIMQREASDNRALRRMIAHELGVFLARMHDAGVTHPDPHPGNFLVQVLPSRVARFTLLDVHAVHFGKPLNWKQTRDNLVLFNRWFQVRATASERHRFWRTYFGRRVTLKLPAGFTRQKLAHEIEEATLKSNRRFWSGRRSRYLGNNRQFRRVKQGELRGHVLRTLPRCVLDSWLKQPHQVFDHPERPLLKNSRSSTVAEISIPTESGAAPAIAKRFILKSPWHAVKNLLRPSPALRSWLNGQNLLDRWLPTARPLLFLQVRKWGILPGTAFILFEKIPDAVGLDEAITVDLPEDHLQLWLRRLARVLRLMHDRDVSHRDLKAPNILLRNVRLDPDTAEPVFIDLVGVVTGQVVPMSERVQNLARLNVSFRDHPRIRRTDRLRFLREYLHHTSDWASWKSWWKQIEQATVEKVVKNQRSGRPLA